MTAAVALGVICTLDAAGVQALVMGGWGVDALAGRQRRKHRDLDLIVDHRDMDAAMAALRGLGYREWYRTPSEIPLGDLDPAGEAVSLRDPKMRVTELHPAAMRGSPAEVATGVIDGHPVRCLSAEQQIRAHVGYGRVWRPSERGGRRDLRFARKLVETGRAREGD
jgi:lincosamide nucleotidyltransferase A/C/D/E